MGVSLLIFFVLLNFTLGLVSVALAHIAFCIGFVAIVVRARLAGMDESLVEAARDCGATPWQAFAYVTLPLIMPGVIAGALMAFTLSIDDFVITFFTAGAGTVTLAAADLLDDQDRGDAGGQRRVNAADAAHVGADRDCVEGFPEPAALGLGEASMKKLLAARRAARRAARARRQGPAAPVQLEQLHRARRRSSASRRCASARSCRPTTRTTRSFWPSSRPAPRATTCWSPPSNAVQTLIKGNQLKPLDHGEAAQHEERRPGVHEHQVRPGQQVLGPVRDVDHDPRLQRREDEGAGPADRHVGGHLRSQVPGQGEGPRDRARQLERALRRRARVPGLLRQRHRREALEGSGGPHQEGEALLGRVQRVVVHQGADRRQHLARARLQQRHLPGQPRRARPPAASSRSCRACRRKARCSPSTTW